MNDLSSLRAQITALLSACEAAWPQWPNDKRANLVVALQTLMQCHLHDDHRAVMLVTTGDAQPESVRLLAINADESELDDLVAMLCVFRQLDQEPDDALLH